MNSPIARALREAAATALPPRAFLRRDRGDGLFVTNAPRVAPEADWTAPLSAAGFLCQSESGLIRLTPGPVWLARLELDYPEPPDFLCVSLTRVEGLAPEPESLRLFALGVKALEDASEAPRFDRRLRQRAAECLRLNQTHPHDPTRGGGLYACALLHHEIGGM